MTRSLLAAAFAAALAFPALAETIVVSDAYALSASPHAKSGAAFMTIGNTGTEDDRLIEVRSDAAARAELHTHLIDASGVARMVEVEDGFAIPAGGTHMLARGGDHIMFMGLTAPFEDGKTVPVTLVFEKAGEIAVDIPVDRARASEPGMGHGTMPGHGQTPGG